jgi:hypothetical protein
MLLAGVLAMIVRLRKTQDKLEHPVSLTPHTILICGNCNSVVIAVL